MYHFSRAMYRALADAIVETPPGHHPSNHEAVLHACESAIERLATDRWHFSQPTRTLFRDVRCYFQIADQRRVYRVVDAYLALAGEVIKRQASCSLGLRSDCRATTRKGTPCRRPALAHNGYCPSHQHLAATEEMESPLAA